MCLNKKLMLSFLILFLVFCLFLKPFSADDTPWIEIYDLEPAVEILQGKCRSHSFDIYNAYNYSALIYYVIDRPTDMDIVSSPDDYTLLESGETIDGILSICVSENLPKDNYTIHFQIGTWTKINDTGSYRKGDIKSDRQNIEVVVLSNPEITTTTSTVSETTTIKGQVISTIPIYTPVTTTTIRTFDIDIDIDRPKTGSLLGREKLVTIGVIIIALILIMMPYFTFIRSQKRKTEKKVED